MHDLITNYHKLFRFSFVSQNLSIFFSPNSCRTDLDVGVVSFRQPDHLHAVVQPGTGPNYSVQATPTEHLFSQLLRLEAAGAAGNISYTSQSSRVPSNRSQSKMSRIEALKAKAASLSNRIESEARKLAGQGINYGATTSVDFDNILSPRTSNLDVQCMTETAAQPSENNDMLLRNQRISTVTGHSSYSGAALPGVNCLHDFRESKDRGHTNFTNPPTISADVEGPTFNSYTKKKRMESDLGIEERPEEETLRTKHNKENGAAHHDSSAESISEGPLLSEGSFSDEASPPHRSSNHEPRQDYLKAADYTATQIKDDQRLLEFQREAAKCSPLSPTFSQLHSSRAHWEELNKGSPLSVINIFIKSLHGHNKGKFAHACVHSNPITALISPLKAQICVPQNSASFWHTHTQTSCGPYK